MGFKALLIPKRGPGSAPVWAEFGAIRRRQDSEARTLHENLCRLVNVSRVPELRSTKLYQVGGRLLDFEGLFLAQGENIQRFAHVTVPNMGETIKDEDGEGVERGLGEVNPPQLEI